MHITDQHVRTLLDYRSVVTQLGLAFTDLAQGRAQMHPRQRSECLDAKLSSMGAIWHAAGVAGAKIYTTLAGAFCFAIVLFDTRSNQVLAVLDGQELTRFRTSAITSLVASRVLASRPPRRLALIGAGVQGRAQAECLFEHFAFEELCVVDPLADRAWCAALGEKWKTTVRVAEAEDAVRGADLVVTATRSAQPVFDGSWLKAGTVVAAMGTSSPKNRELDDLTLQRAGRIYVDWRPQGLEEAGELALWSQGRDLAKVSDVGNLLTQAGDADPAGITVFKSVGVGLADVATAQLVHERYRAAAPASP